MFRCIIVWHAIILACATVVAVDKARIAAIAFPMSDATAGGRVPGCVAIVDTAEDNKAILLAAAGWRTGGPGPCLNER